MASSGTFTGPRGGPSTGPWLTLAWNILETDITNNRSKVRLSLTLHADYELYFSASKTGVVQGTSFTHTTGFSGTGSKQLKVLDVWVAHNSDGTKSQTFSASFNITSTIRGTYVSTLTVSGTAVLNPIARASDFTEFSFTNPVISKDYMSTLNYAFTRKDSSYSHLMTLKIGSKIVKQWTSTDSGYQYIAVTGDEINEIIKAMPNATSATLTLTMQTKNGTTNIGSAVSRTEVISLNENIKPSIDQILTSIDGSGKDRTIGKYIQGISKVYASFIGVAGFGANVSSESITVKRQSDNANSQIISGNAGATPNPLSLSGVYLVTASVTDSRGRSATYETTITVDAYISPTITKFTATRGTPSTTVNAVIDASWSTLGGNNPANITITSVNNVGTSKQLYSLVGSTAGRLNTNQTYTAQSDASSFIYTITVTDSFGKSAIAQVTLGTSFVELTISKGKGVGIGKVHEQGALDVNGDAYIAGKLLTTQGVGPAGIIHQFAGSVAPVGYLICDGSAVSRTTYADLFAVIGTTYGTGNGSSTFNLPDMRGRVPVGYTSGETEFNALNKKGGDKTHVLSEAEMPRHSHSMKYNNASSIGTSSYTHATGGYGTQTTDTALGFANINSTGGNQPHNNLQPYITLNHIIKY